jgi:transaldolase
MIDPVRAIEAKLQRKRAERELLDAEIRQKATKREAITAEIAKLDSALEVYRELENEAAGGRNQAGELFEVILPPFIPLPASETSSATPTQSSLSERHNLAGCTIVEAAVQVLKEIDGNAAHYRKIAEEAVKRGYRGRQADFEVTATSFYQTLLRESHGGGPIQMTKQGVFSLRDSAESKTPAVNHQALGPDD